MIRGGWNAERLKRREASTALHGRSGPMPSCLASSMRAWRARTNRVSTRDLEARLGNPALRGSIEDQRGRDREGDNVPDREARDGSRLERAKNAEGCSEVI